MDFKRYLKIFTLVVLSFILAYTVSLRSISKKYESQITSLKNEIQFKDRAIVDLENKLSPPKAVSIKSVIQIPGISPSDLQQALKKKGLYAGAVDVPLSQRIVEAVKEFQKRNNLTADGVVGKRTWKLLKD